MTTTTIPGTGRSLISALTAAVIGLAIAIGGFAPAAAQQGSSIPAPIVIPGSQGKETSTLELPSMPAKQGGDSLNIPPQVPQTGQELVLPMRELRQQPGYEQVTVTVTEPSGSYVTGLQKEDFKLYMDGLQRPIEFFRQDLNTPVSVGILVDTSGSMTPKIPQARAAIAQFLRDLNDKDDVFLFAFSSHPFLLQPFTTNHDLVMRRLALLHAYGQTALFDVIMQGLQMVQRGRYDKKALLVVTDGMDNTSAATVNDVVAQARRMGVLVYSIGIGDPSGSGIGLSIGPFVVGGGDESEHVDAETLHTLSTESGARTYIIRQAGDGEALRRACENISLELREQYTIGFLAPDPTAGGYRSLKVDVPGKSGADVRVRKGIEVGGRSAPTGLDPSVAGGP
ncbi:MAG TPA: VWA domain-containing protein [Candidatus Binatus sp.]|uniref:VWA domain-containing protein n=1 Tax=Candidatus Binatus sp. TaxID=2811406 RepID=UPI002B46CA73|nr:VWA domain-containing protein [Candidatus Binatus sp.]HKN14470.1 VWA domain-containing protein [Candidatus Binatus sp.]